MVAGFRIERPLGAGQMGPVYEAVQLSLHRRVALRLLTGNEPVGASVDHPNIVPIYEAGEWEGRRFAVGRLVRGRSLAELLGAGSVSPRRFDDLMDAVTDAVAAAHRAGVTHGHLTASNVIVDRSGTPFVADFGLRRPGATEPDLAALAALRSRRPKRARRTARLSLAAAVVGLLAVAAVLLVVGQDGADTGAGEPIASTGCAPDPDPNTPACIVSQEVLGGRSTQVRADGVVRRWAVRGAAGELSLQVLRRRDGRTVRAGFSQPVRVRGRGRRTFPANLNVERGDRIGVLLAPGARIGLGPRQGARARLWDGQRNPLPRGSTAVDGELLLRARVTPRARAVTPPQLSGRRAAAAAPGRVLAGVEVDGEPAGVDVRLVRVGRAIAIDSLSGSRRLARIMVPDADVRGRVLELTGTCEYPGAVCLEWLNGGDPTPRVHAYSLARRWSLSG